MGFSNIEALKAALVGAAVAGVAQVEEEVYSTFAEKLSKYYGEFAPAEYIRTGELRSSLQRTGAGSTGSGAFAKVYFNTPGYMTGMVPIQSTPITGEYGWATWDGGKVLKTAMHGSHGGYVGGTAIWDEAIGELGDLEGKLLAAVLANL